MENKKLQDSGLEIDVISASGPVKQKKWPLFPHSSDSSNHPWIKSKWIILKCATLSMEKLIPNHIQIIPNSHGPFFSSRIPMFRTSQINRQQFPQIFAPPILSNKWSGCSIYLTPEKKKKMSPNCQGTIEAAIEAGRFCSQGFFAGPTLWANST